MAGASLLTLIDDIAGLLDDVATLTKAATTKTAGVLGDDLALNAQQVTGMAADRELPVVWSVAKGSAKNKLIIVPAALAISAVAPWAVTVLLMAGGIFLCFEGFEKILHSIQHRRHKPDAPTAAPRVDAPVDLEAFEKERIKGAIRTDVVLSAEIIVITLGTVADEPLIKQLLVLCTVAAAITVGVYGLVAGIVKLDDLGLALSLRPGAVPQRIGRAILLAAPYFMQLLSVAGTIAMFLVGGGILTHGIPPLHHLKESLAGLAVGWAPVAEFLFDGLAGLVLGALAALLVGVVVKLRAKTKQDA